MPNPNQHTPDISATQKAVLEQMFGAHWGRAAVAGFKRDPSQNLQDGAWNVVFAEGQANLRLRCRHDWNNYFAVSTFKVPVGGGLLRRTRANFEALHVLMFDDVGTKIPDQFILSRLGQPHVITETSPGNFQWLYRLAEPIKSLARAEMLINGWIKLFKDNGYPDPGQSAVTRVARLPGMNTKAKYGGNAVVTSILMDWADLGPLPDGSEAATAAGIEDFPGTDQEAEDAGLAPGGRQVKVAPLGEHQADPTLQILNELGLVKGHQGGTSDKYDITCPWVDEHTAGQDDGAFYGVGGGGAFKCHHGHCQDKDIDDFRAALDELVAEAGGKRLRQREVKAEFEDLGEGADPGRAVWLAARAMGIASTALARWIDALNKRFAIIGTSAGPRVLEKMGGIIDRNIEWRFYTFAQFKEHVGSLPLLVPSAKTATGAGPGPGRPAAAAKGSPMGAAWLRDPRARRYDHAMVWPPGGAPCPANVFNMWEGLGVEPAPGAPQGLGGLEWELIHEFLFKVICGGDLPAFEYLCRWLAWGLQNPGEPTGTAIILQGLPATGKGTLGKLFGMLFGAHGLLTERGKDIVGRFNAILEDKIFVFADEAIFAGDPRTAPRLRGMVTNPSITVEAKGQNQRIIKNRLKILIATNDLHAMEIQSGDRRWFVLSTGTGHAHAVWVGWGDAGEAVPNAPETDRDAYFDRLNAVLHPTAAEARAFMRDLLGLDLSGWRAARMPLTKAKGVQISLSLKGVDRWFLDLSETDAPAPWSWVNGQGVDLSLGGTAGQVEDWVPVVNDGYAVKHDVYEAYYAWAMAHPKERFDVLSPSKFWQRARELVGVVRDPGKAVTPAANGTGVSCRQLRNPTRELIGFPTREEMNETLVSRLRLN